MHLFEEGLAISLKSRPASFFIPLYSDYYEAIYRVLHSGVHLTPYKVLKLTRRYGRCCRIALLCVPS